MRLSKLEKASLTLLVLLGLLFAYSANRAVYKGPAYLPAPEQTMLAGVETISLSTGSGDVRLELVASYNLAAGVRGRKNYRGDLLAAVSPMDLALAWGDLNQPAMLDLVKYSQSGRWYRYTTKSGAVSVSHVGLHSANTHIIPASADVLITLRQIRTNHYVELEGYLVNVVLESTTLRTSLSRADSGAGACEIFYVTSARVHR